MRLWVARNEDIYDDESSRYTPDEVLICYDKPVLEYNSEEHRRVWCCARMMSSAPAYMFADELKEAECIELNDDTVNNQKTFYDILMDNPKLLDGDIQVNGSDKTYELKKFIRIDEEVYCILKDKDGDISCHHISTVKK